MARAEAKDDDQKRRLMLENGSTWLFESSWRGLLPYEEALGLQLELVEKRRLSQIPDHVLGLEHPHVITLGKRSRLDPEIPPGPTVWIDRGGEATVHSEGQLVIYPLVHLRPRFELRAWVDFLHEVSQRTFARVGIPTDKGHQSGLWTGRGKIAFLGLRIKNGISLHGLSLNIANDLALFGGLKACGVRDARLDSLRNHGLSISPQEFFDLWMQEFRGLSCARWES